MENIVVISLAGNQLEIKIPVGFDEFCQSAIKEMGEGVGSGWWVMETTKGEKVSIRLRSIDFMKEIKPKTRKPRKKKEVVESDPYEGKYGLGGDIY